MDIVKTINNYLNEATSFSGTKMFMVGNWLNLDKLFKTNEIDILGAELEFELVDYDHEPAMTKEAAERAKRQMGTGVKLTKVSDSRASYTIDIKKVDVNKLIKMIDRLDNEYAGDIQAFMDIYVYVKMGKGEKVKDFENKWYNLFELEYEPK